MSSVFAQLLDTLPLHLVVQELTRGSAADFKRVTAREAAELLVNLPRFGPKHHPLPAESDSSDYKHVKVWSWRTNDINTVSDVDCRVYDLGNAGHRVFDLVRFGSVLDNDGKLSLDNAVFVELDSGTLIRLPLEERFVHSRWYVKGGRSAAKAHPLWPLEQVQDSALVVAFAYEALRPGPTSTQEVVGPYGLDREPRSKKAIESLEAGASDPDWGEDVTAGDFMPEDQDCRPAAEAGDEPYCGAVVPARFLVALCFSVHCPRADFDPGGVAYMGRVFPQIFVKANVPLTKVDGSVEMWRPAATTVTAPGSVVPKDHHGHVHHESGAIGPLLTTDANEDILPGPTLPFWSEIFAYFDADAKRIASSGFMHMVRAAQQNERQRERQRYGTRHAPPVFGYHAVDPVRTLVKYPGQGEYDGIHVAPTMAIHPRPNQYEWYVFHPAIDAKRVSITNPSAWEFDAVKMAPICSHDCLHTHWRWGHELSGNAIPVFGWSNAGEKSLPYMERGRAAVHPWQDVYVAIPDERCFVYRAQMARAASEPIPRFFKVVVNHHGSAYVTRIARRLAYEAAIKMVAASKEIALLRDDVPLEVASSMGYFYWLLRWMAEMTPYVPGKIARVPVERVELTETQLREAREF